MVPPSAICAVSMGAHLCTMHIDPPHSRKYSFSGILRSHEGPLTTRKHPLGRADLHSRPCLCSNVNVNHDSLDNTHSRETSIRSISGSEYHGQNAPRNLLLRLSNARRVGVLVLRVCSCIHHLVCRKQHPRQSNILSNDRTSHRAYWTPLLSFGC